MSNTQTLQRGRQHSMEWLVEILCKLQVGESGREGKIAVKTAVFAELQVGE